MKKYVKADDLIEVTTLEEMIADSKKAIKEWWEVALQLADGDIKRACERLIRSAACGTLSTALQNVQKLQSTDGEEHRGVTIEQMADFIYCSPCFLAMIGWVVGEKLLTDDLDIDTGEGEQCAES